MMFDVPGNHIKSIRTGDAGWVLKDNFILSPRAGFDISPDCPREYRQILATCIDRGWVAPVAYIYDHELTFDTLKGTVL
jgi:hypothetical protein